MSGLPIMVDRKHMSLIELGNGVIFFTANEPFSYRSAKELVDDGSLIQKILGIPIKRSLRTNRYESAAELMKVLIDDTGPLLAWCLALDSECLQSIKNGVSEITNHLVSNSDIQTIDRAVEEFVCQNLKLAKG